MEKDEDGEEQRDVNDRESDMEHEKDEDEEDTMNEESRGLKRSQEREEEVSDSFHINFPPQKARRPSHVSRNIELSTLSL
jgi:hypothetical protein